MKRADAEGLGRALLHAHTGIVLPENTSLKPDQRATLARYAERAEAAFEDVRCKLVGKECTCWTLAQLVAADLARLQPQSEEQDDTPKMRRAS